MAANTEIATYKAMIYKYYGDTYLSFGDSGGNTYELFYDALGQERGSTGKGVKA